MSGSSLPQGVTAKCVPNITRSPSAEKHFTVQKPLSWISSICHSYLIVFSHPYSYAMVSLTNLLFICDLVLSRSNKCCYTFTHGGLLALHIFFFYFINQSFGKIFNMGLLNENKNLFFQYIRKIHLHQVGNKLV